MSKLICVEFSPKTGSNNNSIKLSPLIGCVGETLEKFLNSKSDLAIPVRFPLIGPGSRIMLTRGERDPSDPYQLQIEAIDLDRNSLFVIKDKIPVSLYKRVTFRKPQELFERPVYLSTFSKHILITWIKNFAKFYRHSWIWKWEKATFPYQPVFIEARIYGINTVIDTYDARKFDGVAMEIIYKPWPSDELSEKGIKKLRSCSDLYLFSNSGEYIDYIDGVKINREEADWLLLISRYSKFMTAKQSVEVSKGLNIQKAKKEEECAYGESPISLKQTVAH